MTILFFLYIIGFGVFAVLSLRLPSTQQSIKPLLAAFFVGIFWPIILLAGFCIGLYKAFRTVSNEDDKINH